MKHLTSSLQKCQARERPGKIEKHVTRRHDGLSAMWVLGWIRKENMSFKGKEKVKS